MCIIMFDIVDSVGASPDSIVRVLVRTRTHGPWTRTRADSDSHPVDSDSDSRHVDSDSSMSPVESGQHLKANANILSLIMNNLEKK